MSIGKYEKEMSGADGGENRRRCAAKTAAAIKRGIAV
jgi:hypothetical protein